MGGCGQVGAAARNAWACARRAQRAHAVAQRRRHAGAGMHAGRTCRAGRSRPTPRPAAHLFASSLVCSGAPRARHRGWLPKRAPAAPAAPYAAAMTYGPSAIVAGGAPSSTSAVSAYDAACDGSARGAHAWRPAMLVGGGPCCCTTCVVRSAGVGGGERAGDRRLAGKLGAGRLSAGGGGVKVAAPRARAVRGWPRCCRRPTRGSLDPPWPLHAWPPAHPAPPQAPPTPHAPVRACSGVSPQTDSSACL